MKMTKSEFVDWYIRHERKCVYCDIEEEDLGIFGDSLNSKTALLTVDCVNNEKGYELGNVVLACLRCNFTKNDFFTFGEMREIAQSYIKRRWQNAIGRKG